MSPHVGAVITDKDRNIADDLYAAAVGGFPHRAPLLEEKELDDAQHLQLVLQLQKRFFHCCGFARGQLGRPGIPGYASVTLAQNGEENEILQPPIVVGAKTFEAVAWSPLRCLEKLLRGLLQQRHFRGTDGIVVHPFDFGGKFSDLGSIQPPAFSQPLQGDQKLISREGRDSRVRRISIPERSKWKHLPKMLFGT